MSFQSLPFNQQENQLFISDGFGKKILVVDDNIATLEIIDLVLTDAGYAVKQASSVDKAIKELIKGNVFVLLTDLQLPTITGWELASLARFYNPNIKVIVLTGYDSLAKPPNIGLVDLVMSKPIKADLLVEQIDRVALL
ncbi:MAG: response regulator [Blastocatellia bacterium]